MSCAAGPDLSESGLVFALDVANRKGISPLGCTGFNGASQLVKNIISQLDTIDSYNGVKLGNLSYYTAFAIDYPEGSYGGAAANRDGITPGFNVTSGTKTFDFGNLKTVYIHKVVALAFLPTDNTERGVRHKNKNRTDNSLENIEWIVRKDQQEQAQEYILNKTITDRILQVHIACQRKGVRVPDSYEFTNSS